MGLVAVAFQVLGKNVERDWQSDRVLWQDHVMLKENKTIDLKLRSRPKNQRSEHTCKPVRSANIPVRMAFLELQVEKTLINSYPMAKSNLSN